MENARGVWQPDRRRVQVRKIDAETNEIVDVIPVGRPGQVRVVGEYVLVSSETDQTLTRVAADTGEVTTSGASGADGAWPPRASGSSG